MSLQEQEFIFPWIVYQENIGILGMQGTGKTTEAKDILDTIPDVPRLIVSPQKPLEHYGAYGEEINKVSDIVNGTAQVWNGDFSISTNERICQTLMARCDNMLYLLDDAHEFCSKQKMPPHWGRLIQSGRNKGICGLYLTPSPNLLNNQVLQSCQNIFAFNLQMRNQIEWVQENYFGDDAEILLQKDRRNKKIIFSEQIAPYAEKYDVLPTHSFLYRYYKHTYNQIVLGEIENG